MDRVRGRRGRRLLGPLVLALGLLAITALASREPLSTPGKAGGGTAGGLRIDASPWEFLLIGGGGLLAFIWLLFSGGPPRRTPLAGKMRRLLLQIAVVIIASLLITGGLEGLHRHAAPPVHRSLRSGSPRPPVSGRPSFIVPGWVTWGIVGTLVAGVLLLVVGATIRTRGNEQPTLPSAVESAVAAALVDLDTIADPRLAIIAAYHRMEQSLAAAGFPRAAAEAPREYLRRIAGALEIDPKPLGTLTTLFEAAKFSLRRLDAGARQRAITAFHVLQAQLA